MKRSEMIQSIENAGEEKEGHYAWYYISPEQVLDIIESLGMLPPHILNKSVEEDLTPFEEIIFRDELVDIDYHIWHPESEDTDELPEV